MATGLENTGLNGSDTFSKVPNFTKKKLQMVLEILQKVYIHQFDKLKGTGHNLIQLLGANVH